MREENLAKLPKWAQESFKRLQLENDDLTRKLEKVTSTLPKTSISHYESYLDVHQYIPNNSKVNYVLGGEREELRATLCKDAKTGKDCVEIRCPEGQLSIKPIGTNTVRIFIE